MRSVRVSEVVKAYAREIARLGKQSNKFMREAVRLKRQTVHLADDVGLMAEPDPNLQKARPPERRAPGVARRQLRTAVRPSAPCRP